MMTSPIHRWKYDHGKMLWRACPQNSGGNNDAGITVEGGASVAIITVNASGVGIIREYRM